MSPSETGPNWAVPSFVMPGTVAENARFLAGRVQEIALCFFETAGCLAYGPDDMPQPGLRGLSGSFGGQPDAPASKEGPSLRYHVHLPIDLDWNEGKSFRERGRHAARTAIRVAGKAAALSPRMAVLHPPAASPTEACFLLDAFLESWQASCPAVPLLVENLPDNGLEGLSPELFGDGGFHVCLDVGHLMASGRSASFMESPLAGNIGLMHWSAPGGADRHLALTEFTETELALVRSILALAPRDITHVIEVFSWERVLLSWPVFYKLWMERYHQAQGIS